MRNIEVPSSNLQGASSNLQGAGGQDDAGGCRPTTAPQQSLHRSPTHPHYKEAEYHQTRLTLRYDGPGEDQDTDLVGGCRLTIYCSTASTLSTTISTYLLHLLAQVEVVQQPRGAYTLPVFRGQLAVGGTNMMETIIMTTHYLLQTSSGSCPGGWRATPGASPSTSTSGHT